MTDLLKKEIEDAVKLLKLTNDEEEYLNSLIRLAFKEGKLSVLYDMVKDSNI